MRRTIRQAAGQPLCGLARLHRSQEGREVAQMRGLFLFSVKEGGGDGSASTPFLVLE